MSEPSVFHMELEITLDHSSSVVRKQSTGTCNVFTVEDMETVVHTGGEKTPSVAPLDAPDAAADVRVAQRRLHAARVPQQHVLVVAGNKHRNLTTEECS